MKRLLLNSLIFAIICSLTACSGMSRRDQGTLGGAVIGGVAGGALTGSVGGAAIGAVGGGLIGNAVSR